MARRALFPPGSREVSDRLSLSPGLLSSDHVFVTGMTGSRADGSMPDDLRTQFENAFEKIGTVLNGAGLGLDAIVEMTSYHVGLSDHFELFCDIRAAHLTPPFPAWTAVEVAGLRREGAAVEIRVVATVRPD